LQQADLAQFDAFLASPGGEAFSYAPICPIFLGNEEGSMPVTTFLTMIFAVIAGSGLTVLAIAEFGLLKVLPALIALGLLARWGMAHVPGDDEPA